MQRMHPTRPSNTHSFEPSHLTSQRPQRPQRPSAKLSRTSAFDGRVTVARVQALLYRHRWIRWAAASTAALIVVISLRSDPPEPVLTSTTAVPAGPAAMLPAGTRGVPIPLTGKPFAVHNRVDVHAVADGAAVVRGALIVESGDGETVVAIPEAQVDATVDALFTGGVTLVLVPSTNASSN